MMVSDPDAEWSGYDERCAGEDRGNGSDYSSSLSSYLNDVKELPLLSPEEQTQLFQLIEGVRDRLRRRLARFGFTANEFLRFLERCQSCAADFGDFFQVSSLPEELRGKSVESYCAQWRSRIVPLAERLKNTALSDPAAAVPLREEVVRELTRHALSGDYVSEYAGILCDYVMLLPPEARPGGAAPPCLQAVPAETRRLLEERTWMPLEELLPEAALLQEDAAQLETLQNRMIEGNLRFVINVAQHYRRRGVPFSDLIQEGNIGLLKAVKKFDCKLGNKFSTYAVWWVRNGMLRLLSEQSRVIRIPIHMLNAINSIRLAELRYLQCHGCEPDNEEIARILELPVARVSALKKMACQAISLQQTVMNGDGDATRLEELLEFDDAAADPVRDFARRILYDNLYKILHSLPERDQQILIMRFGLFGQQSLSLSDLARKLNLSRERIRQIIQRIFSQLRDPMFLRYFEGGNRL